jgi:hypothetical protein
MSALRKTGSDSCGTTEMVQSSPRVDRKRTFQFGGNYRRAICIIKRTVGTNGGSRCPFIAAFYFNYA